ncbi:type II toxin-antitoxin system VapC family toxin [Mesorhizobium quangtriensis]|uniref:type II toxin-antitoxin system VapC family toxin n=1 Tax=Mesorhizobium quangtriensis TaxID=3157709 RepID=UPI003CCD1743
MAVDTSAIIAVLKDEPDASQLIACIARASQRCISAGSVLECGIVVGAQYGEAGLRGMRELCAGLSLEIVPVDADQARMGYETFRRYGRGSRHPANLNFGDCFSYALAKTRNLPLLFKGDDFVHTDIEPALKPARR